MLEKTCDKTKAEYMVCPEGHSVPFKPWNYAKDFSDGDTDALTLQPMYENGLFCHGCNRPYGLSKLKEPSVE